MFTKAFPECGYMEISTASCTASWTVCQNNDYKEIFLLNPVHIVRSFIICLVSCFVTIYSSVCCLFGKNDLVWCKKFFWVAYQLHYWLTYILQIDIITSCRTQFHPFGLYTERIFSTLQIKVDPHWMQLIEQLITRSVFCFNKSCTVVFTDGIIKIFLKRLIEEVTVCLPTCQTALGTASLFNVMARSAKKLWQTLRWVERECINFRIINKRLQ